MATQVAARCPECGGCTLGPVSVGEDAVCDRARTGRIGADRAEVAELRREGRGCEVVRGQVPEVGGPGEAFERAEQRSPSVVEADIAATRIEGRVDVRRRRLDGTVG